MNSVRVRPESSAPARAEDGKESQVTTTATHADAGNLSDVGSRLIFFKKLQAVTNKVHATANIDEIMLELSQDICGMFNADRLTIYAFTEDKAHIVSKVKTGLGSFKDLRLPVSDQSIAGYVALSRSAVNIRDAHDEEELKAVNPGLRLMSEVDQRTGYRTKQVLAAPIVDAASGQPVIFHTEQMLKRELGRSFKIGGRTLKTTDLNQTLDRKD